MRSTQVVLKNVALVALGMLAAFAIMRWLPTDRSAQAQQELLMPEQAVGVVAAPAKGRTGTEPLSTDEQKTAASIALKYLGSQRVSAKDNPAVPADQQLELLFAERHEESKATYARGAWERRADVYLYDYRRDGVILNVVNLATGKIDSSDFARGAQPPLTQNEIDRAVQIVMTHPQAGKTLSQEFARLTGTNLKDASQVEVAGFIQLTDPSSSPLVRAASCGSHRCAQLLFSTPSGEMVSITPIVDLSTGLFVSLNN